MKKIAQILRQVLRKSAQNLTEDRRLLIEQAVGNYGQQIINTLQNSKCYTPILRKCETNTNGIIDANGTSCRTYAAACIAKNSDNSLYQIGECFSWSNNDKIECIVGFTNTKKSRIYRYEHQCNECTLDINPSNGINDCVDCEGQLWTSGEVWGCLDCPNCSNYGGNLTPPVNTDDGSCLGCTDINSPNYEPNADVDDGSCDPITPTYKCYQGLCEDPGDGSGQHANLSDCIASPECDRWECREEDGLANTPIIKGCYQCNTNQYDEINQTWSTGCQYIDKTDCKPSCGESPVIDDPCVDYLPMGAMTSPPGDIDCCRALYGDFSNVFNNSTNLYDPTQPGRECEQEWTLQGNSPADGWKECCTTPPKKIECHKCNDGHPTANNFPGPNCPPGWTLASLFDPKSCKKPNPTHRPKDINTNNLGGVNLDKELSTLQEGVQIKGKLLNKLRMSKLAGIKRK